MWNGNDRVCVEEEVEARVSVGVDFSSYEVTKAVFTPPLLLHRSHYLRISLSSAPVALIKPENICHRDC